MMPFSEAWVILKATRQTTLGEFHPDFPSPFGPMTAISNQPTKLSQNKWREQLNQFQNVEDFDESMAQPYESFIHEGMKAKPPSNDSLDWEKPYLYHSPKNKVGVKPFDLTGKKGNWFAPASNFNDFVEEQRLLHGQDVTNMGLNDPNSRVVGIRMPLDASIGQFRDKGYSGEGAEAFIEGDIPPERLVMVPKMHAHRRSGKAWPDDLGRNDA